MEQWEYHLSHEKAIRDIQCQILNIPIPKNDPIGGLTMPKNLFMKFDGAKFWPLLKQKGHTAMDFNSCECHKHKEK